MPAIDNIGNSITSIPLTDQGSTPTTPSSGKTRIYTKSDGLYIVNAAGTVTGPLAVSSTGAAADGWTAATGTWTYASATTITVPSGAAAIYSVGDKVKLTQTTVKYFYIVNVADTLLTVTAGSDYSVANAAITSPYYSHTTTPVGFPTFFNYSPSIAAAGASTPPSYSTVLAHFSLNGKWCNLLVDLDNSSGGTAGSGADVILIGFPIAQKSSLNKSIGSGTNYEAGGTNAGIYVRSYSTTQMYFTKSDMTGISCNDQSSTVRYFVFEAQYLIA